MKRINGIVKSLLDLDFYKMTMAQVAFELYPNVLVKYSFTNRTKSVHLAKFVNEKDLRRELDLVASLKVKEKELNKLRKSGIYSEKFLNFLKTLKLSPVHIERDGDHYKIEIDGTWPEAIFWETHILGIINELYYRSLMKKEGKSLEEVWQEGKKRLYEKIDILKLNPTIMFTEFGSRRRFSRDWQEEVLRILKKEVPNQLAGTSNVYLAMKYDLKPIGTFAHEMFMVFSGIYHGSDEEIVASHNKVLQIWWDRYGWDLSVALTDTYGTDFFFRDFTREQAENWKGLRQDSGDPIDFGLKAIANYERHGIDPKKKLLVFSDGLFIKLILKIHQKFYGLIQLLYGWGTDLTNDVGFEPLSLVIKVSMAEGHHVVKLSDNLAKATGNPETVELFKRLFNHMVNFDESCKY